MKVTRERKKLAEPIKSPMFELPGYCLEWRDLTFSVSKEESKNYNVLSLCRKDPGKIEILKKASGHIQTGDLVAVLGSSGAGKTTLLAAISQRLRGDLSGYVVVNSNKVGQQEMTELSSFLPQYEIQSQSLTAYEHLYFMAHFKMDRRITKADKKHRVNSLLFLIGLRDSSNSRISHLSGGERKRLSLAEELLNDPPFIFCDEPTTGLDSYSAYSVIRTLRKLCTKESDIKSSVKTLYSNSEISKSMEIEMTEIPVWNYQAFFNANSKKKAVICSIHQPTSDIFELFTHIVLMDAGRIIYQGSSDDAMMFFTRLNMGCPKNTNPSDHFIKVVASMSNDVKNSDLILENFEIEQSMKLQSGMWRKSSDESDYKQKPVKFKRLPWVNQVYYLLRITILEDIRDIRTSLYETFFFLITAFFIVTTYAFIPGINQTSIPEISGSFFMVTSEIIFTFSYGVTYIFPSNLPKIRREVGEKTYSLSAYMVSLMIVILPRSFIKTSVFFSMFYLSVSYVQGFILFLKMFLVIWMSAITATSYGLFVSSIFESVFLACEMAAPFDFLFFAFSGAYLNVDYVPYLKFLSLFYYTNEAMMNLYWGNITDIACFADENGTDVLPCFRNGAEVLQQRNFSSSEETFVTNLACLMILTILFAGFAFLFIRRFIRRSGYY